MFKYHRRDLQIMGFRIGSRNVDYGLRTTELKLDIYQDIVTYRNPLKYCEIKGSRLKITSNKM